MADIVRRSECNAATDDPAQEPRARRSEPRKHHYLPELIQRRFAGSDLHLWSFDKRHPERGVARKPIKRLFRVKHLYTISRDGLRDTTTETRLSAIETRAEPVIDRVVADARAGRATAFSHADRSALVDLFVAQYRRSPDHHRAPLVRRALADFFAGKWAEWERLHGPVTEAERALLLDEKFMLEGARDVIAHHAADPLETVTPTMMRRGFSVMRITAPRRSFILGSSSYVRFRAKGSGRRDLADPGVELWLPIARDVAIGSAGRADFSAFVEADDVRIRKINGEIASASTVFASASRELVEGYARTALRALRLRGPWEAP